MNTLKVISNIVQADIDSDTQIDMDSLDHLQLIMDCEAAFDVQIIDSQGFECKTYGDLVELVESCK